MAGDSGEHIVQRTACLADGAHLLHQARKQTVSGHRLAQRLAAGEVLAQAQHRLLIQRIAARTGHWSQRFHQRHTCGERGGQRAGETGEGGIAQQIANHRQLQRQAQTPQTKRGLAPVSPTQSPDTAARKQQQPAKVLPQPIGQANHPLSKSRQLRAEAAEHRLKLRHHLKQQQAGNTEPGQQHDQWIGHGLFQPRAQRLAMLLQTGDLLKHAFQAAGLFSGSNQIAVQRIEIFGMPTQRIRQIAARADIGFQRTQQADQHRVAAALGNHLKRLQQRDTGTDQTGQLAAELA
ncbi:hypothetical protein D3C80_1009960 [compost metagenome]